MKEISKVTIPTVSHLSYDSENIIIYAYRKKGEDKSVIDDQISRLEEYCRENGYNIVAMVTETECCKPASKYNSFLNEVLTFCLRHAGRNARVHKFLFTNWSKVAHDIQNTASVLSSLKALNVEVDSIDPCVEIDIDSEGDSFETKQVVRLFVAMIMHEEAFPYSYIARSLCR